MFEVTLTGTNLSDFRVKVIATDGQHFLNDLN